LISFELARELRRRNWSLPVHLFLSACRSPVRVRSVLPMFNLSDEAFTAELKKLNGTPQEFFDHPEILATLLPMLRADFELTDTYEYPPELPLNCPITVYGGRADHLAALDSLAHWERETSQGYRKQVFDGDHFFIHSHKAEFIETLKHDLFQAMTMPA